MLEAAEIIKDIEAGSSMAATINRDVPHYKRVNNDLQYRRLKAATITALAQKIRDIATEDALDADVLLAHGQQILAGQKVFE